MPGRISFRVPVALLSALCCCVLQAQAPLEHHAAETRIAEIRSRLERNIRQRPADTELASYVRQYLAQAARELKAGRVFEARLLADAADACRRPLDHLAHIGARENGPPPPGAPDAREHLRQVYFRLRLCDTFLKQIPPPVPNRLLARAREFYDKAVQASQSGEPASADEYTRAADDLTHALESLAQAAAQ